MNIYKTKITGHNEEFTFECYDNIESIEINEHFLFFFGGVADVQICDSENVKFEINKNDRVRDNNKIDFVTDFWKKCYKIKSTDFNLLNVN